MSYVKIAGFTCEKPDDLYLCSFSDVRLCDEFIYEPMAGGQIRFEKTSATEAVNLRTREAEYFLPNHEVLYAYKP